MFSYILNYKTSILIDICNLQPKVPSSALSEASSSEWIDENISFVNPDGQNEMVKPKPVPSPEVYENVPLPVIQEYSHYSMNEPQPSTSADSEPVKKHSRYCRCKNFVKRLISNTLPRKKDRN